MKNPQIININPTDQGGDAAISFIGSDVIDDITQLPISDSIPVIQVKIKLLDLTNNSYQEMGSLNMSYQPYAKFWTIPIINFASILTNRHKYVGTVSAEDSSNMRSFQILEFTVDNDGLEDVWMHLPYEIVISGGSAKFIWYQKDHIGDVDFAVWMADAYQDGVGTTPATSAEKVTHRGAIIPYSIIL